jgi:fluoroacetyl-CoA thioesterase
MTPTFGPGLSYRCSYKVPEADGLRVTFEVSTNDGLDLIGKGRHQRFVVAWSRFNLRLDQNAKSLAATS